MVAPLHLRVLLDQARIKILDESDCDTWDSLREHCGEGRLQDLKEYVAAKPGLDAELARFVCEFNNVRREGNEAAHSAEPGRIRDAVRQRPIGSTERRLLERLFKFVYNSDV